MKYWFVLLIAFQCYQSQNLITNGDFEKYKSCPNDISQIELAEGWKNQNRGSCDYFNTCSENKLVSIPNTFADEGGFAHSGNGYAGIGYFPLQNNHEFLQTKLLNNLVSEKLYCLSFFIKNSTNRLPMHKELTFMFSEKDIYSKSVDFYSIDIIERNSLTVFKLNESDFKNWEKSSFIYKAKGNEKFITIGYNKLKDIVDFKKRAKGAMKSFYFLIDDISLVEIKDSSACDCAPKKEVVVKTEVVKVDSVVKPKNKFDEAKDKPLVINNIVFRNNKSTLLPSSYKELNLLAEYLKQNTLYKIELNGYTDNTGKESENITLSTSRAKAIADYLTDSGIDKKRISFKGFGSKFPINPNTTEINKQLNRRVEFIIKTK